jgi:outer membrane lipoprotein-sorting protein
MLMGLISRLFIIVILLQISCGNLRALAIDEVYRLMQNKYRTVENYSADFTQTNYWQLQDLEMRSEGSIYIAGEKMAVIYRKPAGQKLVIDEALYLIDEAEKTVIITGIEQTGGFYRPTEIIDYYWDRSEKEIIPLEAEEYLIILTPENDPYTAEIGLKVSKNEYLITAVTYIDHEQNRVEFLFFDEQINKTIDKSVFLIPSDQTYTVIDNR